MLLGSVRDFAVRDDRWPLPAERVDLRHVARAFTKGTVGTLEEFGASIGTPLPPAQSADAPARASSQVAEIARYFNAAAARAR